MHKTAAIMRDVQEANEDFEKRLQNSEINVTYDDEHDMLLVSIGPPREAVMVEVARRLRYRLDPETDKIVGMTITAVRKGFLRDSPDFKAHFETLFGQPATGGLGSNGSHGSGTKSIRCIERIGTG